MEIIDGGVSTPKGFSTYGIHCGIKKKRLDLAMISSDRPAWAVGAYTQNKMRAPPVELMVKRSSPKLQAVVMNSGNANAITGEQGMKDAQAMIDATAECLGIDSDLVGVASTGVISHYMPMDKIIPGIKEISEKLGTGREQDHLAAEAILTTDKTIKEAACRITLKDGTVITIAGMAKGSGMISPSMKALHATTLSFITTDAVLTKVPTYKWQECINKSFNMINVDGDQSTNDTSIMLANGAAGGKPVDDNHEFWEGVLYVLKSLAKQVVMDGEGATKLIELKVSGAKTDKEARTTGRWIISSALVKTAVFGADPNFGRILAALGNSGSEFDLTKIKLCIGDGNEIAVLFENGMPQLIPGGESEAKAREILKHSRIDVSLDLGIGNGSAEAWGCDLTYEYVKINAEYTT